MQQQFTDSLNAVMASVTSLLSDAPSVIAYALIDFIDKSVEDTIDRMNYSSQIPVYLAKGVNDTVKKNYALKYHGIAVKSNNPSTPSSQ